ncbi:MAG TPA: hypothetical protein VN176_17765 [Verrucomicrobiae bacterium]|jgi:hypothetical protein|nr:hypothetical protein [Verrucomicrobiae bacterium]
MKSENIKIAFVLAGAALLCFAVSPVFAQHGHGGGASGGMHGSSSATHGNSADAKADKTDKSSSSKGSSVSEKLTDNTKLSAKLQSLLPAGTNLQTAAQGFKNLGQFVAAVHVSHNLGIPFDQLKAKMIGPPKESLGKAIHALKPAASSKDETKKGEKQAKQDLDDSKTSS